MLYSFLLSSLASRSAVLLRRLRMSLPRIVGAWHAVEQPLETNKGARSLLEVNELVRERPSPQARTRLAERRCIGVPKVRAFLATKPHDHPPIGTIFDQIPNRIGGLAQGKDLTDLRLQRTLLQIPKDRLIS